MEKGVVLRTDQDVRRMGMERKKRGAESPKDRRLAFKGAMKLELRSKVEGGMRLIWEGDPQECRVWGWLESTRQGGRRGSNTLAPPGGGSLQKGLDAGGAQVGLSGPLASGEVMRLQG